jgi:hypothetical protein
MPVHAKLAGYNAGPSHLALEFYLSQDKGKLIEGTGGYSGGGGKVR